MTLELAGREPRRPVAYAPPASYTATYRMVHAVHSGAPLDSTATFTLLTAGRGTARGLERRMAISAVEGPAGLDLSHFRRLEAVQLLDGHGLRVEEPPASAGPLNLEWMAQDLVVPLPAEPVGVGARWRAVRVAGAGTGAASYALESSDGTGLTVTFEAVWDLRAAAGVPAARRTSKGKLRVAFDEPTATGESTSSVTAEGAPPIAMSLSVTRL